MLKRSEDARDHRGNIHVLNTALLLCDVNPQCKEIHAKMLCSEEQETQAASDNRSLLMPPDCEHQESNALN